MAARMGGFIKAFGDHPGYLRIDGKPAMKFQFWDRFQGTMSPEVLRQTLLNAEEAAGREIYWIVQAGAAEDLYSLGEIDAFVTMSNMLLPEAGVDGFLEDPDLNWDEVAHHARILPEQRERFPHLDLGWWVYPGFDETPRVARWDQERFRWLPRRGGRTLVETLQRYAEASPDFILLTSWNDWEENTAIEPGLMYDGYEGDPYLYCRIIAAAKGKTFEPAPLPPEDSVDPWMLQPLYGVDRTPPVVQHIRYLPLQPGVVATVTDSGGPVPSAVAVARGDAYIDARSPDTRELAGILHMEPEWPEAGDLVLRAGQPLTITLDPEALDADSERDVFLGLEYADEAEGAVRITYPTEHETLDWRLTENKVYRVQTSIALENDGDLQAAVRRLRGFQVTEEPLTLRLELDGDGEIPITRLHVFHGLQHRAEGRPIDGLGPESQVRTFLFDTPNLMGDAPKAAYIVATDHAGNESMPVPIHGANQHPLANRP